MDDLFLSRRGAIGRSSFYQCGSYIPLNDFVFYQRRFRVHGLVVWRCSVASARGPYRQGCPRGLGTSIHPNRCVDKKGILPFCSMTAMFRVITLEKFQSCFFRLLWKARPIWSRSFVSRSLVLCSVVSCGEDGDLKVWNLDVLLQKGKMKTRKSRDCSSSDESSTLSKKEDHSDTHSVTSEFDIREHVSWTYESY